jgi:hypothetical protein
LYCICTVDVVEQEGGRYCTACVAYGGCCGSSQRACCSIDLLELIYREVAYITEVRGTVLQFELIVETAIFDCKILTSVNFSLFRLTMEALTFSNLTVVKDSLHETLTYDGQLKLDG